MPWSDDWPWFEHPLFNDLTVPTCAMTCPGSAWATDRGRGHLNVIDPVIDDDVRPAVAQPSPARPGPVDCCTCAMHQLKFKTATYHLTLTSNIVANSRLTSRRQCSSNYVLNCATNCPNRLRLMRTIYYWSIHNCDIYFELGRDSRVNVDVRSTNQPEYYASP